ncbi:MAG: hypothetical protein LBD46_02380 [Endomicrobium sp.]|jgi:hypothetical protein|nr:hypothetical protein [Endomicrobium sp.]
MTNEKEWDFIICETHCGSPCHKNIIKRELLFGMQCELSKQNFDVDFYKKIKEKYLSL